MAIIATWNVNSINVRIEVLKNWLTRVNPDILMLQELKCTEDKFPHDQLADFGYNIVVSGQKTYNGVSILSKYPVEDVVYHFDFEPDITQARYVELVTRINKNIFRIISVYVPNGQGILSEKFSYKLEFMDRFYDHCQKILNYGENVIIGGDFNIAPEIIDMHEENDGICCSAVERKKLQKIFGLGFYDSFRLLNPNIQEFSWWDYRAGAFAQNLGLRIDHILLSPSATNVLKKAYIDKIVRSEEKTSDHAPVVIEIL